MHLRDLFLRTGRKWVRFFNKNTREQLQLKKKLSNHNYFSAEQTRLLIRRRASGQLPMVVLGIILSINAYSQRITLQKNNVPLPAVLGEIEKQSNNRYQFFYNESLLQGSKNVTIDVTNVSVEDALNKCFQGQPVTYALVDNTIIIKRKEQAIYDNTQATAVKNVTVNGRVVNSNGDPVAGATVSVKGTNVAIATDANGNFSLPDVEENATLVISSVSHEQQEVKINTKHSLVISLQDKINQLDEALVVAYNTSTVRSNVSAVTTVKGEQIKNLPNRSFDKSLQGFVPGLLVTQGTGQPGGGLSNFVLRGVATGANPNDMPGARNPLIVIDGVPVTQDAAQISSSISTPYQNPMAQLNPSDIESISVLKDAAAFALYGSKASNGVILITTKKGKAGKTLFNFRHQTDLAERLEGKAKMLNQQQYLELVYETFKNTDPVFWTDFRIDSALKKKFPVQPNGAFYPQSDWLNELYRNAATTISNELSMSGGNDRQLFYLNLEYTKQNGIEKKTGFDRKSVRFNYENKPFEWLKLGINTTLSYSVQDYGNGVAEFADGRMSPLNAIRDANGNYIPHYYWGASTSSNMNSNNSHFPNPALQQQLNINRNTSYRGLSKFYGDVRFLKYFSFTPSLGVDFMLTEAREKKHPLLAFSGGAPGIGQLIEKDIRNASIISTNILRYNRVFHGTHSLNLLVGQEAQILTNKYLMTERQNLSSNPIGQQFNIGTLVSGFGLTTKQKLVSYFHQTNYGYKDKYFLSGSIRTDGSSLFGDNHRFGTYWSLGTGWVASSESFMKGMKGWLDYLKIRGSVGAAGNSSAILNTLRYDQIGITNFLNGTAVFPYGYGVGNPGIKWEKTFTWDVGFEIRMLRERISFTADFYTRKTSDLIGNIDLAPATGYGSLRDNIGDLQNKGVELAVFADIIKSRDFRWNMQANLSMNRNKLTHAVHPMEGPTGATTITKNTIVVNGIGKNYNSFYLVRWAGVDQNTGKPLWLDANDKPTSNYADASLAFVGKPQPDGFGSVSQAFFYRGFELSAMFYYQYGFQVYHAPGSFTFLPNDGIDPFINQTTAALNRWQKPGDKAANPRRLLFGSVLGMSDGGTNNSTRYLFDGDFIRLSNLTLGYNLSKRLLERLHLKSMKVYLQGYNLATWTKYSSRQDAENTSNTGTAMINYPLQRSYSFGVNIGF
jgi:TonB-linked SusC/RagA family outer membrane protein